MSSLLDDLDAKAWRSAEQAQQKIAGPKELCSQNN